MQEVLCKFQYLNLFIILLTSFYQYSLMNILKHPFLDGYALLSMVSTKDGLNIILVKYKRYTIGTVAFRREDGCGDFGNIIYVDDVTVEDEYQRKGIGRMMMELVIYIATQEKRDIVLASTTWAIPFYHKLKFRRIADSSNRMVYRVKS